METNSKDRPPASTQEKKEINRMINIGTLALQEAYKAVQNLGAAGLDQVSKNQFGDTALKGDVDAEEAVINILGKNKVPIKVISEEHGILVIGENPLYLGILDGLDGSGVYKKDRLGGRYGTMFAIYRGTDPTYDDYLYGGIIEHARNKLYFASKKQGAWVIENGARKPIHCSRSAALSEKSRLYADTNFDEVYKTNVVSNFVKRIGLQDITCMRSSAIHYADLSEGNVDVVIEVTRKGNLEIAVAFPLIKEAGGEMVDSRGESLVSKKYFEFGQKNNLIVVSAATKSLADVVLDRTGV